MDEEFDEWEDLIKRIADDLTDQIRREYFMHYLHTVRTLSSPSEKLVYWHLAMFQPQTLRTIRRSLGIHENTALKALNKLIAKGHIIRDDQHLYWLNRKPDEKHDP